MGYRFRGRGQFTAGETRTSKSFVYTGRRVLVRGQNFEITWNGPQMYADLLNAMESALQQLSTEALDYMRTVVPVDTGALRDSCFVIVDADSGRIELQIGATMPYSIFVELGTATHSAQPYIRPTLDWAIAQLPNLVREEVARRAA